MKISTCRINNPLERLMELHCEAGAWAAIEALPNHYPEQASVLGREPTCRFSRDPMHVKTASRS
jgi:hypothetical protein